MEEKTLVDPESGLEFVLVPGGEFTMGLDEEEDARPVHRVKLASFRMGRTEVTREQYAVFLKATGHPEPAHWKHELFAKDGCPVIGATWADAVVYSRWCGGRLPTEAEWEYAARGTDRRRYPWGNEPPDPTRAIFHRDIGFDGTQIVGQTPAGRSPFGLSDMAGGVFEWCSDWYSEDYYARAPRENPTGPPEGTQRVIRGGSWVSLPDACRAGARSQFPPVKSSVLIGFRVARPL